MSIPVIRLFAATFKTKAHSITDAQILVVENPKNSFMME